MLVLVECAGFAAIQITVTTPAQAQWRDDRYPYLNRRRQPGGFFQDLFGPPRRYERRYPTQQSAPQHVDSSRAPRAAKRDESVPPTTTIVVMGDGMADWLAYGLEVAFAETPEVAIVREAKRRSGLIRYERKSDLDWWHVARDVLSQQKANYVVMMLGLNDRENISEKDVEAEKQKEQAKAAAEAAAAAAAKAASKPAAEAQAGDQAGEQKKTDQPPIAAPKPAPPPPKRSPNGIIQFRSDRWAKVYSHRIDETIAALKSKGVPVFWVGLPSIRGTKSTADAVYLNDLFRERAERAGINYIDVWDGFVDDSGKYSSYGPDYEGQTRRLRSGDGVYFTKRGARKLAHYVEREIRRYMSNRALQVSLPSGPVAMPEAGKNAVRPVVGPVVPLTTTRGETNQLLGGGGRRPIYGDAIANDVLKKGEPIAAPPGRADNFVWRHAGDQADAGKPEATGAAPASGDAAKPAVRRVDPKSGDSRSDLRGGAGGVQPGTAATSLPQNAPIPAPKPKPKSGSAEKAKQDAATHRAARRRTVFPFDPFGWLR